MSLGGLMSGIMLMMLVVVVADERIGLTADPPTQYVDSTGITFRLIPAGVFSMGSAASDDKAFDDEKPQHKVRITNAFYLSETEVTQAQYQRVMGGNPSRFCGADHPVEGVTWIEATEFCSRLSAKERVKYRLPTEAEWEYACRAGGGDGEPACGEADIGKHAWYLENSCGRTHPVRSKSPNAFGLFDMQGNVWEWCYDSYDPYYYSDSPTTDPRGPDADWDRVFRGGAWNSSADRCRPSARRWFPPEFPTKRYGVVGFRVVVEQEATSPRER